MHQTAYWLWCEVGWLFVTWLIEMDFCRSSLWKFKCSVASWEHGQQSKSLRQSTKSSAVNLNARNLIWRQNLLWFVSFGGWGWTRFKTFLLPPVPCTISVHASILSSSLLLCSPVVACLALLTWTMVPLPLSCWKEHLDNSHWLFSNCPAGRVSSSVWCFKVPLIPLVQVFPAFTDFSILPTHPPTPTPVIFRVKECSRVLEYWLWSSRKTKQSKEEPVHRSFLLLLQCHPS